MAMLSPDLKVFSKFKFEIQPVGIKYFLNRPQGIKRLETNMAFCEMLRKAQTSASPFYIDKDNEDCFGKIALGMAEAPAFAESGQLGVKYEIFQDARANSRLYQHISKFEKGLVNYVAFSRLSKLNFDPDLLVLTATPSQAEIVLRAMSYSTGEIWAPMTTGVLGCSWLLVYPYKSGKVNYTITGMAFGMKAKRIFPEGMVLISIPFNWIPVIVKNLEEMKWVLPAYTDGVEKFKEREKKIVEDLTRECQEDQKSQPAHSK
jgi:uncharacterized protein (DUF169 family)